MTSYEHSYVSWYFKHNRKRLLLVFGVLLIALLMPIYIQASQDSVKHEDILGLPLVPQLIIITVVCLVLAIVIPMLQFQYLMKKRSCDLFLPMPIKHNRFFVIQYLIGLCMIAAPILMFFAIAACERTSWHFVSLYAIYFLGIGIFIMTVYTMITFFVVHCNTFWDAVCISLGISFVSVLLFITINQLLDNIVTQTSLGASRGNEFFPIELIGCMISPIVSIGYFLSGLMNACYDNQACSVDQLISSTNAFSIPWVLIIAFWLIMGILAWYFAYRTHQRRAGEQSEQRTNAKVVYPLLIFLITMTLLFQNIFNVSLMWLTIVVFALLNFIAERKIIIHKYMIVSFVCMAALTGTIAFTLIETNAFDTIYEMPKQEDIKSAKLYLYFDLESAPKHNDQKIQIFTSSDIKNAEVLDEITSWHQQLIDTYTEDFDQGQCAMILNYNLDDGTTISRNYNIDLTKYHEQVVSLMERLYRSYDVDYASTHYFKVEE